MYWLDLAIIYFALGAPFGVLRITAKRKITPFAYLRMATGYLLWPLVAIRNVARFFIAKPVAEGTKTNDLDAIRTEIEKALFPDAATSLHSAATRNDSTAARRDLYAFREVFYRYTGLAQAIAEFRIQNAESNPFHSSFTIHHSPLIRAACIARCDLQKLESQLAASRQDVIEIMRASNSNVSEMTHVVAILANYFDDKTLAARHSASLEKA